MNASRHAVAFVLAAAVALPGCAGYSRSFRIPRGAEGVKTVAIRIAKNKTLYMDLENEFTHELQRELWLKAKLRPANPGAADALITSTIDSYERVPLREFDTDEVAKYSIVVTVSYEFIRLPSEGRRRMKIASGDGLSRKADFLVATNITETQARAEAVRKAARKVVSHIFEREW